jgi:predicted PurR-regulated permease PerM
MDRKYLKVCLYAFFTIGALLLLHRVLQASDNIWKSVIGGLGFLLALVSPFIFAILIAYILKPAVGGIEILLGKIFRKEKQARGRQLAALLIVYAAVVALIAVTMSSVIPSIVRNIRELIMHWQQYQASLTAYYQSLLVTYPILAGPDVQNFFQTQLAAIGSDLHVTAASITSTVMHILSSIFSFVIALILSFYLLNERKTIVSSFGSLLHARLGEKRASSVMRFLDDVDRVFGRYISAKLLICVVLFVIGFAVFALLGVRYVPLMSAIVALSTLVPYIGPFVGAVPPIVLALLDSPQKALYVGIAILAMHLVDGYFIEPFIFSDRMGLSPFWILLSIILGGGLFGLWGVLLAVPVAAVIKLLIVKYIHSRQAKKQGEQAEKKPE